MIHSTLEISQNPLEHVDMRLARIMHVKAGLLDGIGDVRTSERRSAARVAIGHTCTGENVGDVLLLREKHAIAISGDGDSKEMMQRAEVLEMKLLTESSNRRAKKRARGGREDDVIDVEQQVDEVGTVALDEERGIRAGGDEAKRDKVSGEAAEPCTRSLLEAVE